MGEKMQKGKIVKWLAEVGDQLKAGEVLVEVETEKATMELDNYETGTLLYQAPEGAEVPLNGLIAIIGKPDESVEQVLKEVLDEKLPVSPPKQEEVVEEKTAHKEYPYHADIDTDKATMELESYEAGTMLYLAPKGKPIAVNGIIAIIGDAMTDLDQLAAMHGLEPPKVHPSDITKEPEIPADSFWAKLKKWFS